MNLDFKANYFLLRTPLYPFKDIFNFNAFLSKLKDKTLLESIFLASPSLYERLIDLENNRIVDKNESDKLVLSLYKYYLRMSCRCTPFGTFAGISFGTFSEKTDLEISSISENRKGVRLDMDLINKISLTILNDSQAKSKLKFYPNNSIYDFEEELRLIEYKYIGQFRAHHLINVEKSDYLNRVLSSAENGRLIQELCDILVCDEISNDEAHEFILELIDSKILISELEPLITGESNLHRIVKFVEINFPESVLQVRLSSIQTILARIEEQRIGGSIDEYLKIENEVKELITNHDKNYLFQVDLAKPTKKKLIGNNVLKEAHKIIELFSRINSVSENFNLKKFRETFFERYGEREVQLVEVIDSEMGIGYPIGEQAYSDNAPLIKDLPVMNSENQSYISSHWERFLYNKYVEALSTGSKSIILDDITIDELFPKDSNQNDFLPNHLYCNCSILAKSSEEIDKNNFRMTLEFMGTGHSQLTGRFCYLDEELNESVRQSLKENDQSNENQIFAEIVHIPQARIGNILLRPVLSDYEIPIITRSSLNNDHVILLDDLWISVKGERLFLRSKSKNKEVIPRLSSAHNFSLNPLPIYNFLCDLQFQGRRKLLTWSWGVLKEFPFLPRVEFNKTIISKAKWLLKKEDISKGSVSEENLKAHLRKRDIPNYVSLLDGDNSLPLSIQEENCFTILLQEINKNETLYLEEILFNDSNLFVSDGQNQFTNEFLIPFSAKKRKSENVTYSPRKTEELQNQTSRRFYPGSEWYFLKIYCGVKTADKILTERIKPLSEKLISDHVIDRWFFIRFYDPQPHIRVRFHSTPGNETKLMQKVQEELHSLFDSKFVNKVQIDTYDRELERYGAGNIDLSEQLFFIDSNAVLRILDLLHGDAGDDLRWLIALSGVDHLLSAFLFNLHDKKRFMEILGDNFRREFNYTTKEAKKALSNKYRTHRKDIERFLSQDASIFFEYEPIFRELKIREETIRECSTQIRNLCSSGKIDVSLNQLLASYIHMFLNRLFRSRQRFQEMVVYDLLEQHYKSLSARIKANQKIVETQLK